MDQKMFIDFKQFITHHLQFSWNVGFKQHVLCNSGATV